MGIAFLLIALAGICASNSYPGIGVAALVIGILGFIFSKATID